MQRASVIALFGPTGVGKTVVALALADALREVGEDPIAVSADALQVYRGLEVLTGAATPEEQASLEHRLISFLPVDSQFSAGRYAQLAHWEIDEILAAGRRPIVVGGTGLYLRAALTDLSLRPPPPPGVRERWLEELQRRGPHALHSELARRDGRAASTIEPSDRQRIVRALELHESGQGTISATESELWTADTRHPTLLAGLVMDRAALYERIERRVERMLEAGAVAEVQRADRAGAGPTARKALGFEELLAGDPKAMTRRTRNYARRQLTWMRKLEGVEQVDLTGRTPRDAAAQILHLWLAGSGIGPPLST